MNKILLNQLKNRRKDLKVSQRDLSERIGVNGKCVGTWELRKSRIFVDNFEAWANSLGYEIVLVDSRLISKDTLRV